MKFFSISLALAPCASTRILRDTSLTPPSVPSVPVYNADGPEYFTTIGYKFDVKNSGTFDPLSVTKIPLATQNACGAYNSPKETSMSMGMNMGLGNKVHVHKDPVQCIPKGHVGSNGIAAAITATAKQGLVGIFENRIATGTEHNGKHKDMKYKIFQAPIPARDILEKLTYKDLEVIDSRQLTVPARMVVCHSVATAWVCHAPPATFLYSVKARVHLKGSSGKTNINLAVMCHGSSPEAPRDHTDCHIAPAGDLVIYPEDAGSSAYQLAAEEEEQEEDGYVTSRLLSPSLNNYRASDTDTPSKPGNHITEEKEGQQEQGGGTGGQRDLDPRSAFSSRMLRGVYKHKSTSPFTA